METNTKTKWFLIAALSFTVLGISWYGKPMYSYTWDSHNKLVQAWSLWQNSYQSEELFHYFASGDPEYRFFPHGDNAFGKIQGNYTSAFPVALATIFAPIWAVVGPTGVVLTSSLFLVACCLLLSRFWGFRRFWLFVPIFFTFLMSFTLEFNEHLIVAFLSFLGLSLWLKAGRPISGGMIIGLAVFFRHETLPLLLATGLASVIISVIAKPASALNSRDRGSADSNIGPGEQKQGWIRRAFSNNLIGYTAGATGAVLAFILLNLLLYGHPLGPRFLINAAGLEVDAATRIQWARDLLFWHNVKPGLFGYMPAMALVLFVSLWKARRLDLPERVLFASILIYIPLVLLIVPNNGIMDWGPRYFGPVLLPATVLAHRVWKMKYFGRRFVQGTIFALALVTFSLNYAGLKYLRNARKATQQAIEEMKSRNADVWVFAGIDIFYYSGVQYLHRPILTLDDHSAMNELMQLLEDQSENQRILFLALPAPPRDDSAEPSPEHSELMEMQVRNSLSEEERSFIKSMLLDVETGQIPPGLLFIEGTVQSSL